MRSVPRHGILAVTAAVVLSGAAACGGGDDGGDAEGGGGGSLKVWTIEDVNDRVAAQKRMAADFSTKSGIKVEIIAVAEDQFDSTITSAAAADDLPDVIAALPLAQVRSLSSNDLLNTEISKQVVDELGADTFAPRALELTKNGEDQLAVPSDGWAQLLVYRKDLFQAANLQPPTTYEAIETAVQLSTRYIADRFLPDKAIDLIDEAASAGRKHLAQAAGVLMRRQRYAADLGKALAEPFDQRDPVGARKRYVDHHDFGQRLADRHGRVVTHQDVLAGGELLEPTQVIRQMPGQLALAAYGQILIQRCDQRNGHRCSSKT